MKHLLIPHVGMRTVKTAVAVTLSYLIFVPFGLLYNESYPGVLGYVGPLYACIAGVVCMQSSVGQTLESGMSRFLGVMIGGALGILLLLLEPIMEIRLLKALLLGLTCVAGIWICMLLKRPAACAMACIVPCVMVISGNVHGIDRYYYAAARLAETVVGVAVALAVNRLLPDHRGEAGPGKEPPPAAGGADRAEAPPEHEEGKP